MICKAFGSCQKVPKYDFQSQFSMSDSIFIWNFWYNSAFLIVDFLVTRIFVTLYFPEIIPNFSQGCKSIKTSEDAYNWGEWLIL